MKKRRNLTFPSNVPRRFIYSEDSSSTDDGWSWPTYPPETIDPVSWVTVTSPATTTAETSTTSAPSIEAISTQSSSSTSIPSSTQTVKPAPQSSNPSPVANPSKNAIWTGAKVGLGVCIPLVIILLIAIVSFLMRRRRQRRSMSISVGKDGSMSSDGGGRPFSTGAQVPRSVHWQSVSWEPPEPKMVPQRTTIEVRGEIHRLPTVLRPGPVKTNSWRYDPKAYDMECSPVDSRWSG